MRCFGEQSSRWSLGLIYLSELMCYTFPDNNKVTNKVRYYLCVRAERIRVQWKVMPNLAFPHSTPPILSHRRSLSASAGARRGGPQTPVKSDTCASRDYAVVSHWSFYTPYSWRKEVRESQVQANNAKDSHVKTEAWYWPISSWTRRKPCRFNLMLGLSPIDPRMIEPYGCVR